MVISVLAAIGVAGRAAFFMVPSFKPVAAIVILTGVSFGGEAGFLVGCLIMMLSNMLWDRAPGHHGRCSLLASSGSWQEFFTRKES